MVDVAWTLLQREERFLLVQRSVDDSLGGKWELPGGAVETADGTLLDAAKRELREETGLIGVSMKQLGTTRRNNYRIHVFRCTEWIGSPSLDCDDIMGVGWFTLAQMYAFDHSVSPYLIDTLMFIAYITQHYDHHPEELK